MAEKKNPDYSASAVMLTNPPQVTELLTKFRNEGNALSVINNLIDEAIPKEMKDKRDSIEKRHIETAAVLRQAIDEFGSYQDPDKGEYALKQKRESILYKPELVRQYAPSKVASFVIIESVDSKGLDALLKAGQITPEVARQCGEVKESFAYIIK